ncbi:MAG: hypothetical protein CL570_01165 [Alphaproteobacteria bacterium]|nr:hypothetical protein [Alphaproteobacteria bacterium]HCQ71540.1 hypothetical protein [Rhodospirillaceae bacterium]|tara:strand:- start:51695 stop:52084 length:390 start_codon:yes stop_codon:yes gene_type:complete
MAEEDKKKKDKGWSLSGIFKTAAVAAGTMLLLDPFFAYVWTHLGPGQHIAQIGSAVWGPLFDAVEPGVAMITDPIRDMLGITQEFVASAADGVKTVASSADTINASSNILPSSEPATLLNDKNTLIMGG